MWDDVRVVAAVVTALAALAVFVFGKFWEVVSEMGRNRRRREALVSAIFTEIRHNVEDLERSVAALPSDDFLLNHFQNRPSGNVLIVYSRNMVFFDEMRSEMTALSTDLLERVVRFYSHLEKVYRYCDSVSGEAFRDISVNGKLSVLKELKTKIQEATTAGHDALVAFQLEFGRALLGREALKAPTARDHASSEFLQLVNSARPNIRAPRRNSN